MSKQEFIDKHLEKFISRKLIVFGLSYVALLTGFLESLHFAMIAIIYIGGQAIYDFRKLLHNS